jgi:hypothetical protein
MEALGPRSRAVMNDAITHAIADGIEGTTFRYARASQSIQRWAWNYGRDYAWRIVITLLKDAEWLPPSLRHSRPSGGAQDEREFEVPDDSAAGRRKRPSTVLRQPAYGGAQHERISSEGLAQDAREIDAIAAEQLRAILQPVFGGEALPFGRVARQRRLTERLKQLGIEPSSPPAPLP